MSSDTPPRLPQPLDYATPDADGVPECVPEVEAAIDQGEVPRRMAHHFASNAIAARYLERSIARRFEADVASAACVWCGKSAGRVAVVNWTFRINARPLSIRRRHAQAEGTTATHHSICKRCHSRWVGRISPFVRVGTVFSWIGGLAALAVFGGWLVSKWGVRFPSELFFVAITALVVSVVLSATAKSIEARLMPPAIRRQVPRWLKYGGLLIVTGRRHVVLRTAREAPFAESRD